MRIFAKELRDYTLFVQYGIKPWEDTGLDIRKALAGTKTYINQNPYSPDGDKLIGYYVYPVGDIIIPKLFWDYPELNEPTIINVLHEQGHHLHYTYMGPDDSELWQEWSKITGRDLDFIDTGQRQEKHGIRFVPAYEAFANEFMYTLTWPNRYSLEDWLARLKFYAGLWGQKLMVKIELPIGKKKMIINGREQSIDVPAQIIAGRTMVPLRVVSEALGCDVDWEPKDGPVERVIITKEG